MTCGPSSLCARRDLAREREREKKRGARREFARGRESGGEVVVAIVRKTSSQVLYFVFFPFKVLVLICFFRNSEEWIQSCLWFQRVEESGARENGLGSRGRSVGRR